MKNIEELMQEDYDEEWKVIINTKGEYVLGKQQAILLANEIANGNRGTIMFETFAIAIPYIAEFYRTKRFQKGVLELSASAQEEPWKPISPEKLAKFRKEIYEKLGKKK